MKKIKEYWFPKNDLHCNPVIFNELIKIKDTIKLSNKLNIPLNVCVQAGGNVGIFPIELRKYYKKVYTFEPQEENYLCLVKNISEYNAKDIFHYNMALSNAHENVGICLNKLEKNNYGAFQIDEKGTGIETTTIDKLNLDDCNLIYLDVEGYEYKALEGAKDTILKYRPIIIVENKNLHNSDIVYGRNIKDTVRLIESFGYLLHNEWMRDKVFIPEI